MKNFSKEVWQTASKSKNLLRGFVDCKNERKKKQTVAICKD